ncbi:hypothetical protein GCM10011529_06990 [Polymorphobacter glacialis]|uniref:Uncharacterized protein n=1 Tax=Sandarakinorhabdus glacialis TaxID=1614636 RepID=A0A917E4M7_9SPHN|nr:hypothetical protein GCM10011529_06990 [Polymorphobacter glacialis]
MRDFGGHQGFGDDPDDIAPAGEDGTGGDAHEANAAAAIDEGDAALGEKGAEVGGERRLGGIMTGARAAKDEKGSDHGVLVAKGAGDVSREACARVCTRCASPLKHQA